MKNTELRPEPTIPLPERLDPSDPQNEPIFAAHEAACANNEQGYLDPYSRLFVMTAQFHMNRGHCCARGCRHCPFTQE